MFTFFANARSFGSSWIYLDTKDKTKEWLTHDNTLLQKDKNQEGRSIPKGLRFDVLRRDNYTCKYCGAKAPNVQLHVDHVIPWKIVKKHETSTRNTNGLHSSKQGFCITLEQGLCTVANKASVQ